jgi:hypothetical protein
MYRWVFVLCGVLVLVLFMQPIFAVQDGMYNTRVNAWVHNPFEDSKNPIVVHGGSRIVIYAKLGVSDDEGIGFKPSAFRYLNFFVYHANSDGSNGVLFYYKKHELTSLFEGVASTDSIILGWDNYNVLITYEGNEADNLKPSNCTLKIHATH